MTPNGMFSTKKLSIMKKIYIYWMIAALGALITLSCQKEQNIQEEENKNAPEAEETSGGQQQEPDGRVTIFGATLGASEETKTYITDSEEGGYYIPKWNSSDKIRVNGVESSAADRSEDFTEATFTVEGVEAPYFALAPSAESGREWDSTNKWYTVTVRGTGAPQVYRNYTDESSDNRGTNPTYNMRDAVLAAYSESSTELEFKQITAYYKLTINKGDGVADDTKIKTIYIRQGENASNPNIGGSWRLSYEDNDFVFEPRSLTAILAYNCMKNGDENTDGVDFGSPVIITLPAYNYSNGLIVTVKDTEGHFQSYSIPASSSDLSGKRGKLVTKTLTYSPKSGTINSADEWNAFAEAVNNEENDWDLYKWVGNGTVKIGADITADNLTKITGKKGKFTYNVDGGGHTITLTAAANSLFRNVRGTVSNLTIAGTMSKAGWCCPLVDTLRAGGMIEDVTNKMNITVSPSNNTSAASGIAAFAYGGTISNCTNKGNFEVATDCSASDSYCRVAGILINTMDDLEGPVTIKGCKNEGAITISPSTSSDHYIQYASAAGMVAWVRSKGGTTAYKILLEDCTNTGAITWNAATTPTKQRPVSVGGIVGIASPMTSPEYLTQPGGATTGLNIEFKNCNNSGPVVCKAVVNYTDVTNDDNDSGAKYLGRKVNIGGIAGVLMGLPDKFAVMDNCKNTGTITPYDVTGDDAIGTAVCYSAVMGGLVGTGGNIAFSNSIVNCEIGNGKRTSFSIGGAVGCLWAPFTMDKCYVRFSGKFAKIATTADNRALIACAPKKFGSQTNLSPQSDLNGSSITNSYMGCSGGVFKISKNLSKESTMDQSSNCTTKQYDSSAATLANAVRGQGYTSGQGNDVTFSNNNFWDYSSNPEPWN